MSSVQFISIKVEAGEPLGIRLETHKISYAIGRRIVTTPCCIVTEITSASLAEIHMGDIIISSNNRPLINNKINKTQIEDVLQILSGQLFVARSVIFLRSLSTLNNSSSQITHVTLTNEDCEMIYDRSPTKLTPSTMVEESPYPQHDDEESEISRRVEMQVSRLQKDKENRKRSTDQERIRILEAEKARTIEMEVTKRMEEERRKITIEVQQAKAEAQMLEAEWKRTTHDILRQQQEEQERQTQRAVTEEIKKRVAEQTELEMKAIERQKQMAASDRKAEEDARTLQMETEVQRRAYAEALRISNERALAAEKQRADLAEQALRITEQTKRVEEETQALRLKQQQQEALRWKQQQQEEEMERHRVELLARRKSLEEEAARERQRMEEVVRERQRIEEEDRARRVALSVKLRVDAEAARIKSALQEDEIRKKEEETKKYALELETTKRIEQQVSMRLQEESAKIADRVRHLTPLPSSPPPAFTYTPPVRQLTPLPPPTTPAFTYTPPSAALAASASASASVADNNDSRYRSRSSSNALPPSASTATVTTPSYTTSVNYLSANWTTPQQLTPNNNPYGPTNSQVTTTTSFQPYKQGTDNNGNGSSDLHNAFDNSEFKMFEIDGIPPGPLGLALSTHKVKLTTILMSNVSTTVTIHVVIVKQSKNTTAIQRGDVIMSVNNFTLLADEQQSPGGQTHVNACAHVMSNASHPRSIRVYRSKNINMDENVSVLPANEAMQIIPVIFSPGLDGSRQLLEVLRNESTNGGSNHHHHHHHHHPSSDITTVSSPVNVRALEQTGRQPSDVQAGQPNITDLVQDIERRIQQTQSSPSPSSSSLVPYNSNNNSTSNGQMDINNNDNNYNNNNNNTLNPAVQSSATDAVITQIVFAGHGAMGVTFAHHMISYQVGNYTQLVNVAVVQANTGGSSIRQGDVFLSINNRPVVATPEQLIAANQMGRTFMDGIIANNDAATIPKTLRFFRSSTIDLNHVLQNWYQSNPIPTTTFLNELEASIFLESSVQ